MRTTTAARGMILLAMALGLRPPCSASQASRGRRK